MKKRSINFPGIKTDEGSDPIMHFVDPTDSYSEHEAWRYDVLRGLINSLALPAVMVRVPHRRREPAMFLDEASQRLPASAAQLRAGIWATPAEASVKDRTPVAFEEPSEAELAIRSHFWNYRKDLYQELQALSEPQVAKFFRQYLAPLPIPFPPESKNTHDWSI